jgi:hypothetical protein
VSENPVHRKSVSEKALPRQLGASGQNLPPQNLSSTQERGVGSRTPLFLPPVPSVSNFQLALPGVPGVDSAHTRSRRVSVEQPLRPLFESVHDLLHLPLVGLVEHRGDDLLDPYSYLLIYPLLLLGGSAQFGSLGHRPAQGLGVLPALERLYRFALDLTDPLLRNAQFVRELDKRGGL